MQFEFFKPHPGESFVETTSERLNFVLNPGLAVVRQAAWNTDRTMALASEQWAALAEQQGAANLASVVEQQRTQVADLAGIAIAQEVVEAAPAEPNMLDEPDAVMSENMWADFKAAEAQAQSQGTIPGDDTQNPLGQRSDYELIG